MPMTRDDLVRRASLGGVIIATVIISYTILRDRAVNIGFTDWWTAWLYPIGLDALILGASRVWGQTDISRGTRRMAMIMTLAAIGAGIAAFIVEFSPKGWIAVVFACLIPASLAASLVLTSRVAADRRNASTVDKPDTPPEDLSYSDGERYLYGMDNETDAEYDGPPTFEPSQVSLSLHTDVPTRDTYEQTFARGYPVQKTMFQPDPPHLTIPKPTPPVDEKPEPIFVKNGETVTFTPDPIDIHREDVSRASRGLPPLPVSDEHITEQTVVMPIISAVGPRPQPEPEPPESSSRSISSNRESNGVSADVRKSWVRERLEKGIPTTGADVDKEFPEGSRNGARIVRQVKEAMERENRS